MNESIERIQKWMNGEKPGPYSLELYTDEGCNLFCKFCSAEGHGVKHLDFEFANKIIEEAKELDVRVIRLIGVGEPFLKKEEMIRLMEKIKSYGMQGYTVTNCTLLGDEDVERLVEAGWDEMRVSLHAPDADTHDYLTGHRGAFAKVTRSLALFKKLKEERGLDNPTIRINFVLNKQNFRKIEEMIALCEEYGCGFVLLPLEVPDPSNKYLKELELDQNDREELKKIIQGIKEKIKEYRIEVFLPQISSDVRVDKKNVPESELKESFRQVSYREHKEHSTKQCEVPNKVLPDQAISGMAHPMCYDPWINITMKNYDIFGVCCPSITYMKRQKTEKKYKSLREIWYGDFFNEMRQASMKKELKSYCSFCCNTDTAVFSEELARRHHSGLGSSEQKNKKSREESRKKSIWQKITGKIGGIFG